VSRAGRPGGRSIRQTQSRKPSQAKAAAHSASERRTRQAVELGNRGASFVFRHRVGNGVIFLALLVAGAQLFYLQVPHASGLRAEAAGQLKVTDTEKAVRGNIIDRNNNSPKPSRRTRKLLTRKSGSRRSPRKCRLG
jgi:cell division protein FtsI (penicillin-binding protein 3)